MITLKLHPDGMYYPVSRADKYIMQHCLNENLIAIKPESIDKLRYILAMHDYKLELV